MDLTDLVIFYRDNPVIAAKDLLNVDLAIPQAVILEDMWYNKFVIVTAGRGNGKCVVGDTLIPTSKGFFRIDELGNELYPLSKLDVRVVGYEGVNTTKKWYYDGVQAVNGIRTSQGYEISATDEHRIKVLDNSGNLVWKYCSDIRVGDVVALHRGCSVWSDENKCTEQEALLLGLLVGDGCFRGNKYYLSFTSGDEETRVMFKRSFEELFDANMRLDTSNGRCPSLVSTSKHVWEKLETLGVANGVLSEHKQIPTSVLRSGKSVIVSFLRGLFEADGGCENCYVSYCTKSTVLAKQVHNILLSIGIVSKLRQKPVKYRGEVRTYWVVTISSGNVDKFRDEIGFFSTRKRESLDKICGKKRNTNIDVLYNNEECFRGMWEKTRHVLDNQERKIYDKHFRYYRPSYDTVLQGIKKYPFNDEFKSHLSFLYEKNYFYDKVEAIEQRVDKVYDLVVKDDDHSFVANGFVNHNSFLLGLFASLWAMLHPGQRVGIVAPSFRQCVVGDTYVLTDCGLELVRGLETKPHKMFSRAGLRDCSAMFKNPAQETVELRLGGGIRLGGAPDHRVLSLLPSGVVDYITLESLLVGDHVCVKYNTRCFGNETDLSVYKEEFISRGNLREEFLPNILDEDFSYFLGSLVGDGCVCNKDYLSFINTDAGMLDKSRELFTKYFGGFTEYTNKGGVTTISKGSKLGFAYLRSLGLAGNGSKTKEVPEAVLRTTERNQAAFLRALFDTDGCVYFNPKISHRYKIHYASTSKKLVEQVQLILLNFGVASSVSVNTSQRRNALFCLEVSNKKSILRFIERIGFACEYKSAKAGRISDYIYNTDTTRSNKDYIPNIGKQMEGLVEEIRAKAVKPFEYLHLYRYFDADSKFIGSERSITFRYLNRVLDYCDNNSVSCKGIEYLKEITNSDFLFLEVVGKTKGFECTYDFSVDDEHNYISNGVVSHNSKLVFEEVRKIWQAAPIMQEATEQRPTFQSDRCILTFRSYGTTPQSLIEADPLGTGEKIRGLRMHVVLADEFAQIPEDIFDSVIKPFAATSSSPMERVKEAALIKELKSLGATGDDLIGASQNNKIVMTSSASYKFNHMFHRIEEYLKFIESGRKGFAVRSINYLDMPEGFMNEDIIEEAKATMPAALFRMEYLGIWESDSDGVFKASLLEKCWLSPGDTVKLAGEAGRKYVIACDPARTSDNFAIVVIELGNDYNKVVNAVQYKGIKFPKMAEVLFDFCVRYDTERLVIDSQGGGHAVKDLLADETRFKENIIIDIDDEEYLGVSGNRILQMIKPSPIYNAQANYSTLNVLEQGKLRLPGIPVSGDDAEEQAYENVRELVHQLLSIVVTQTKSGTVHFDVPNGEGHGSQKKDLYSAFIYGVNKVYELSMERDTNENVIWNSGIIIPVDNSSYRASSTADSSRLFIPGGAALSPRIGK